MAKKSAKRTSNRAGSRPDSPPRRPWYEENFTRDYLQRYAHRSDQAARRDMPFIASALGLPRGAHVFDLCCGAGRYSQALARMGWAVTGMDLSYDLLKAAGGARRARACYARGDMRRLPFLNNVFDGAVNLFTSFGYFQKEAENQQVLSGLARILKPGAPFLMDFLNITAVRRQLVPASERCVGALRLSERRWYDDASGRLNKRTEIFGKGGNGIREESVRAYTRQELARMLRKAGMSVVDVYGDLSGSAFAAASSPRCVLLARKRARAGRAGLIAGGRA